MSLISERVGVNLSYRDSGRDNEETSVQVIAEVWEVSDELPDVSSCALAGVGDFVALGREGDTLSLVRGLSDT